MWGAILGWKCVCISERRQYLGLCDESVSVASKVLRAACRLLIHIRCGWLVCGWWYQEVLRNGGTEEREAWQMNKSYMCRDDTLCQPSAKQNVSITTITGAPWHSLKKPWRLHPVNNCTRTYASKLQCTLRREKNLLYDRNISDQRAGV